MKHSYSIDVGLSRWNDCECCAYSVNECVFESAERWLWTQNWWSDTLINMSVGQPVCTSHSNQATWRDVRLLLVALCCNTADTDCIIVHYLCKHSELAVQFRSRLSVVSLLYYKEATELIEIAGHYSPQQLAYKLCNNNISNWIISSCILR